MLRSLHRALAAKPASGVSHSIQQVCRAFSADAAVQQAEPTPAAEPAVGKKVKTLDQFGRAYATGRRKTSVARVWLKEGSGRITVNDKQFIDYFRPISRDHVLEPFIATETAGHYDVFCTVQGGGVTGQAGAVRLGISRALEIFQPSLRAILRRGDYLTRDRRRVERKKYGQKKARKKFQWVKR